MTSINASLGNLYQLSSLLSSGSGSSGSSAGLTTSSTETLAQALDAVDSNSSASGASSYLLDLSPEAQQILGGGTSGSTSSASGTSTSFVLTSAQKTAINNIIEKYKNSPFDQATFDAIQSALQQAGLSPQQLGAEDQVNSFNATNILLSALSGNYSNVQSPTTTASGEQTKESNYMQGIIKLWKSESTTSSASGSSSSGTTTIA